MPQRFLAHRLLLGLLFLPAPALAGPLTPIGVFGNATLAVKVIILALILAAAAALVVAGLKLASGPKLSGGSAFLSGLRLGGPLAGLVGAAYGGLNMALNLANMADPVPLSAIARGGSEVMLLLLLGLVSGSVAVICHWAVEARIDRAVLSV